MMMILKGNGGLSFARAQVQHSHWLLPEFPEGMVVSSEMPSGGASFPFNSAARCALAARSRRSAKGSDFVAGTVWLHQRQRTGVQGVFGAWWCRLPKSGRSVVCCNDVLGSIRIPPPKRELLVRYPRCAPFQGRSFALKIFLIKPLVVLDQLFLELFPRLAPSAWHSGWRPCGAELPRGTKACSK